jgi:hypothetical protein
MTEQNRAAVRIRLKRPLLCRLGFHRWTFWHWGQLGAHCRRCGQEIEQP